MDKHGKAKKSALPPVAVAVAAVAIIILAIVFIGPMLQQPGGEPMPGSDRDGHGCIASAGYTWCEPMQQCIREWETNCTAGLPMGGNITVAEPPKPDSKGCMPSEGYTWCEDKHKCLRVWEEDCPTLQAIDEQVRQQEQQAITPTTGPADNVTAASVG
jgi:hypothetical protein